ncbi:MAG: hypothetical protein ABEH43_05665 [Flavobacteriales bacterium]
MSAIIIVQIMNFLFFGWFGELVGLELGLAKLIHIYIAGPIANFTTAGYLEAQIFSQSGWYVGAGLLSANSFFRDGHKYQGFLGWINSWFLGMFFFWTMFHYGLIAAIFLHTMYNIMVWGVLGVYVIKR